MSKRYARREPAARRVWRKLVYRRDEWTCQWPGCKLGVKSFPFRRIEAHHIRTWARHPESRLDINNGITLCTVHHKHITEREEQFETMLRGILIKRGVLWSRQRQKTEKRDLKRFLSLRLALTASRRSKRRRSRTGRRS